MEQLPLFKDLPFETRQETTPNVIECWVPQNTGFTNGLCWFDSLHGECLLSREDAETYNLRLSKEAGGEKISFRVVKRTIIEEAFPQTLVK